MTVPVDNIQESQEAAAPDACQQHITPPDQLCAECDAQLLWRVGLRDESALADLIHRYRPQLLRLCLRICQDPNDANDLVSEVFWEIWRGASKYNVQRGSVQSYLLLLARSRAIDRLRSNQARHRRHLAVCQAAQDDVNMPNPPGLEERTEASLMVHSALEELDAEQRRAIELAFFDGLTHREVAQALETPLGTIKSRIRAGLKSLKGKLTKEFT